MTMYTVSFHKRMDVRVNAATPGDAIKLACPWWNGVQSIDGNVLLGCVEGEHPIRSGLDPLSGSRKPPTGPTPGTPTIADQIDLEVRAA